MRLVAETGIVFTREVRPTLRNPVGLVFGMAQPVVFLVVFGSLLSGLTWGDGASWQWFVPGTLIMMGLSGTVSAGYLLLAEMSGGSLDRMLVTPVSRAAMLVGRTLKESVLLLAQSTLIIVVVLPFGFRLHLVGALVAMLLLSVVGVGLGAFSCALAVVARKQEPMFYVVQQTLMFPLLMLSGVLLPIDTAPSWMRLLSRLNPLTYVVEAERALFAGDVAGSAVLGGLVSAVAFAVVGVLVGARAMRRVA
ncbi:ABC transporter permease [Umezawaea tangerina]|uniref:Transport permease protein n=1 Tax=Umezawaea tangerina TaxID=84725 RepID=A0A2T0SPD2_9PSEU|nr:ABC transporter permease [Umezawaea tangerina]PRY35267.1 ABC-2 type transport system permease protein [Umezawaea tangerina]